VVGQVYEGTVKSTTAFGAFIEIMPGTEALLHISELRWGRTDKTEDVVKKGDRVTVKLIDRDDRGRLRLSMKALQPKPEGEGDAGGNGGGREPRGPREPAAAGVTDGGEGSYAGESGGAPAGESRERRPRRGGRGGGGGRSRE
jgi:polyribonucleotide nucleotidyltransferase